jgi:cytochrome c oxidase assembly factor CtaG
VPSEPPTPANLLLGGRSQPLPTLAILVALVWWAWAVGRVNARSPDRAAYPAVGPWRSSAAMIAPGVRLLSGIERYDTTLFSVHMVQHLLLILVAAPLIALAAPITLLLRVASRRPAAARAAASPLAGHALLSFPSVRGFAFVVVMWGAHFSPLFDVALENPLAHDLEHALFLGTALLFWWPVVAADPVPWRLAHPSRSLYTFLQMPLNTFLAVIILSAAVPLYRHYATLQLPWPGWTATALDDQPLAAGIMWVGGDLLFIAAIGRSCGAGCVPRRQTRNVRIDAPTPSAP